MYRTTRYRLLPRTRENAAFLCQMAGACRYVWNYFLEQHQHEYRAYQNGRGKCPSPTFFSLGKKFIQLRNSAGHEWLLDLPCRPVRYTAKYLADAYKQAIQGKRGFPKFKIRYQSEDSFTLPDRVQVKEGLLWIPKRGWMKLRRRGIDPYANGHPVRAVVKHELGKWYAYITWEIPDVEAKDNGLAVGIDCNCGQYATSAGDLFRMPDMVRKEIKRKRYQRQMSRRQRIQSTLPDGRVVWVDSKRRGRARRKMQKAARGMKHIRKNFLHRTSRRLADRVGTAVVEDLSVKSMTLSTRETAQTLNSTAPRKANLNRSILESGWAQFRQMLEYKMARVKAINPAYTSQTCVSCGYVAKENRISRDLFKCVACGYANHADINAAMNILAPGLGATGRGKAFASIRWPHLTSNFCDPSIPRR